MGDENEDNESVQQPQASGGGSASNGMLFGQFGQPTVPTVTTTGPSSTTTRVKPTAGYMESIDRQQKAASDEKAAVNAGVNVDTAIAQAQKPIYDAELIKQQAMMKARADLAQQYQQRIDEARATLNQRIAQASAEPSSYWADRTEGERTMSRIGVWLSAFGSAVTGGDNLAIKRINENIERDIKVKQARAERLFKLAEQSRGLLSDSYRQRAEDLADADAHRAAGWDMAKKMAESIKMGMIPQSERAAADLKIAQIDQKAAQSLQDAHKNLETKVTSESGHTTTTLPANASAKTAPVYDPETGAPTGVVSPAAAKELNDKSASATKLLGLLDRAEELENRKILGGMVPGRFSPIGEVAHEREQLAKQIDLAAKEWTANNLGRGLPKEMQKFIGELTGTGEEAHWKNKTDEIVNFKNFVKSNLRTAYKSLGAVHATPGIAREGGGEHKATQKLLTPSQALKLARERYAKDKNDAIARQTIEALTGNAEEK